MESSETHNWTGFYAGWSASFYSKRARSLFGSGRVRKRVVRRPDSDSRRNQHRRADLSSRHFCSQVSITQSKHGERIAMVNRIAAAYHRRDGDGVVRLARRIARVLGDCSLDWISYVARNEIIYCTQIKCRTWKELGSQRIEKSSCSLAAESLSPSLQSIGGPNPLFRWVFSICFRLCWRLDSCHAGRSPCSVLFALFLPSFSVLSTHRLLVCLLKCSPS